MTENSHRRLLYALVLAALAAQGCGKTAQQPVDKAQAAVEEFLDSWTRGESPDKFASTHPGITADDPDWKAGYRLMSFLSVESKEEPPRFRCRVSLSLRDRNGRVVDKEVVYEVMPGEKYVISRMQR